MLEEQTAQSNAFHGDARPPIVEVKAFSYRYPRAPAAALKEINLTIQEGEFIGIVGPTGAGKSTLCLALAGLIPQVVGGRVLGEVLLYGRNTARVPLDELLFVSTEQKALVGITFQDPEAQLVGMTVEEDLAFGPENLGLPSAQIEERVSHLLKLIRMEEHRFTFPYKLSGGQKQRIAIGSTMALRPRLIILDEPTSELDPVGRDEVYQVVRDLKERTGLAIVVVEHHTEELAHYCDRLVVMNEGRIIMDDRVERVFREIDLLRDIGVRPPDGIELLVRLARDSGLTIPAGLVHEDEIVAFLRDEAHTILASRT